MTNHENFTVASNGAALVEVEGDGPYSALAHGLVVPDGVPTIAPIDLASRSIRKWRLTAPASAQVHVSILDSPFGAVISLRRCVLPPDPRRWWSPLTVDRWSRSRAFLKRFASPLVALWTLYTDESRPCDWQDITTNGSSYVAALGGDVITVSFLKS